MKTFYKDQLANDFSVACCTWFLSTMVFAAVMGGSFLGAALVGFFLTGIPFGWKFLTMFYSALSSQVVLKAILAVLIGWVTLPIILIGDILFCNAAEA